jgi:hypothetical protein
VGLGGTGRHAHERDRGGHKAGADPIRARLT